MSYHPPPEERRCSATNRRGERCMEWTHDPRITVCRLHGGGAFDRETGQWKGGGPIRHGRYATAVEKIPEWREAYDRHLNDPEISETDHEIAVARTVLERMLERFGDTLASGRAAPTLIAQLGEISRLVERRQKILHERDNVITVRHFDALATRLLAVAEEFYAAEDPEKFRRFMDAVFGVTGRPRALPEGTVVEATATEVP